MCRVTHCQDITCNSGVIHDGALEVSTIYEESEGLVYVKHILLLLLPNSP